MKPTITVNLVDKLKYESSTELARVVFQMRNLTELDLWVLIDDAIPKLQSVEELVLDNHLRNAEPDWEAPVYRAFLEAIGNIPKIGILELRCCGRNPHGRFPIRLLTSMLQRNRGIKELVIFRSLFRGTNDDYQQFGEALCAQTALQEVYAECSLQLPASIEEIERPRTTIQQYSSLIFSALAQVSTLERVCLHISDYQVPAPDSLINMVHTTSKLPPPLTEMYLYGVYLNTQQSVSLAQNLKNHSCLRRLALELYDLDNSNTPAIAELMQSKNTTLESLDLHVRNKMADDDCLFCIASALKHNSTLTSMELYNSKLVSESTEETFAYMLQTNTTLRGLRLLDQNSQRQASNARGEINLYLKLNQRGYRKRILQNFEHLTRSEWVTFLASDSQDRDILYYYLRLNPLLCSSFETVVQSAEPQQIEFSCKRKHISEDSLEYAPNKRKKCSED